MNENEFCQLIDRINDGTASDTDVLLYNKVMNLQFDRAPELQLSQEEKKRIGSALWDRLQKETTYKAGKIWPISKQLAIAASVLMVSAVSLWFYLSTRANDQSPVVIHKDRIRATSVAELRLSNGRRIRLEGKRVGIVHRDDRVTISRDADGILAFTYHTGIKEESLKQDTLTTSAGAIYKIRLPDGSLAALNASSSLTFPERFSAENREIGLLHGEAYFQVAHNAKWPFTVRTKWSLIRDIGTRFDVRAYADDAAIRTVVEEGSVEVNTNRGLVTLHADEGVDVTAGNKLPEIYHANIVTDTDWKDGVFRFNNSRLEDIMLKISRWYNINVTYTDARLKDRRFHGIISRDKKLSEVLNMLAATGHIKFILQEKQLLIEPLNKN